MCELFGFNSNSDGCAAESLCRFAEHSDRNPHGWGLAYYSGSGAILKKQAVEARKSPDYYDAVKNARSSIIISHIRHASCGKIDMANCHPFKQTFLGKEWVFAHNGHFDGVARHPRTAGETDSESVFNLILDNVKEHRQKDNGTVQGSIVEGVSSLFNDYEFGRQVGLNFIMSDGQVLYAFNHHAEKPMYYSKITTPDNDSVMVSTQRLDGNTWEVLPPDRLLLVKEGKIYAITDPI
jgi:glutamine amidotransferase